MRQSADAWYAAVSDLEGLSRHFIGNQQSPGRDLWQAAQQFIARYRAYPQGAPQVFPFSQQHLARIVVLEQFWCPS
jgi:hypothetical protein